MTIELKIPAVGESIQEVQIGQWLKQEGEHVDHDEAIVELETDKASMELPAPSSGVLARILKQDGESVGVGDVIAYLEPDGDHNRDEAQPSTKTAGVAPAPAVAQFQGDSPPRPDQQADEAADSSKRTVTEGPPASPSVRRMLREHHVRAQDIAPTGEGGRLLREDVLNYVDTQRSPPQAADRGPSVVRPEQKPKPEPEPEQKQKPEQKPKTVQTPGVETAAAPSPNDVKPQEPATSMHDADKHDADKHDADKHDADKHDADKVVPMSLIRRRIAERLVDVQQNAALLTTFNEIDLSAVNELRASYREVFREKYGVKLGFMSFFVKAVVDALREFPAVNAEVRGSEIVYHGGYHIGVAIGGGRGLVVPVLRNAERLRFAEIEQGIDDFASRAQSNKLAPADLTGGTFTITNGGIYGSLFSTPIVNPPQSGVLGMHAIQDRPVAREGQVVIRPMMYVALTYDHRIIDGREAVSFLKHVKESIEAPARLLIGI